MLRVGLTGGIGSGKSTVARRLIERGAVLVDSDVLAREVVAAGTPGFDEVVAAFGEQVRGSDGELDRTALAQIVFADPTARERLNAIVHPRVRARAEELIAAAPPDAVVVQDVPLLVEAGMTAAFPLVIVVHADVEERVRRLVRYRGMTEEDARARIAAQASDQERRAAADVWLDNSGTPDDLIAAVDALWEERLVPFEENLRRRRSAPCRHRDTVYDPNWPVLAARLLARVERAVGERGRGVAHIGPTAVPGLPADDVIELQLAVPSSTDIDALRDALAAAGFPDARGTEGDHSPSAGGVRCHGSADPARPVHLYLREQGSPGWRAALLVRDWLRADSRAREEYLAARHRAQYIDHGGPMCCTMGARTWFDTWSCSVIPRAEEWAESSGWSPSLG